MRETRWPSGLVMAVLVTVAWVAPPGKATVAGSVNRGARPAPEVVVWLEPADTTPHPVALPEIVVDQRQLRFVPRTVLVTPGTPVAFLNSDDILHNVFSPSPEPFDLGRFPLSESRTHVFAREGVHVVLCHVHPEMVAYVIVVSSPYGALSDGAGRFEIRDVPPGEYRLQVLSPRTRARITRRVSVPAAGLAGLRLDLRNREDAEAAASW